MSIDTIDEIELDNGRRIQGASEILLPDGPSGLLRGPRGVGTPVGGRPEAGRHAVTEFPLYRDRRNKTPA